mmetsp:Transcript_7225/g.30010  ORF Transcript_7225/g.30010 Transcript_7225/m.30010 type:complete len:334 (+) Transcript_7225:579-1580(+)
MDRDDRSAAVFAQPRGERVGRGGLPRDAELERPQRPQQKPRLQRARHAALGRAAAAQQRRELGVARGRDDDARERVGMPGERLGRRVHDEPRARSERELQRRRRERRVNDHVALPIRGHAARQRRVRRDVGELGRRVLGRLEPADVARRERLAIDEMAVGVERRQRRDGERRAGVDQRARDLVRAVVPARDAQPPARCRWCLREERADRAVHGGEARPVESRRRVDAAVAFDAPQHGLAPLARRHRRARVIVGRRTLGLVGEPLERRRHADRRRDVVGVRVEVRDARVAVHRRRRRAGPRTRRRRRHGATHQRARGASDDAEERRPARRAAWG